MDLKRLLIFSLLVLIAMSLQSQQPAPGKDSTSTASDTVKVDSLELLKREIKTTNQTTLEIVKRTEKKIQSIPAKIENAVLIAQYRQRMIEVYYMKPIKPEPELPPVSVDSTIKKTTSRGLFRFLKKKN